MTMEPAGENFSKACALKRGVCVVNGQQLGTYFALVHEKV